MTEYSKKSLVEIPVDLPLEVFDQDYKLGWSVDEATEFSLKLWLALVQGNARCDIDEQPDSTIQTKGVFSCN